MGWAKARRLAALPAPGGGFRGFGAPHALREAQLTPAPPPLRHLRRQAAGLLVLCVVVGLAALPAALAQTPVVVTVSTAPNPIGSTTSPKYIGVNHGAPGAPCGTARFE